MVTIAVVLAAPLGACGSAAPTAADEPLKIYYLQKQGTQGYFVGEANGARKKAAQLGVELVLGDLGNDTSKTAAAVEAAIAAKADGIIIVVPDPALGPRVAEAAKRARVPLLASDDEICTTRSDPASCTADDLVPRIGFSGTQMGGEVGKKAAELYQQSGWKPQETRIVAAWKSDVTVCTDRVMAALPTFRTRAAVDIRVTNVATDNTPENAKAKVTAAIARTPAAKHWIVWGCNDENVTGGVAALEEAGYAPSDVIGVGINGDLACKVWSTGGPTGLRASLWLNGAEVGALAVESMYNKIKNGTAFKPETFATPTMVSAETYRTAGLTCS